MTYNDIEGCERAIRKHKDELACVIMEPVISGFGYLPGKPEFLQGIRDITKELGIVLIFDEVQSFRLAPGGAQEFLGVVPDMTALGKIIGGGLPVGAFGGRKDIMDLFDPTSGGDVVAHAGTFNANPMTLVAGEVVMNELTPEVYERMNNLGEMLRQKLRAVFDELDMDVQITGIGSLFGIHFTAEEIVNYRQVVKGNQQMRQAMFTGMLNEGVLLQAGCAGAVNALTTEEDVDTLVDSIRKVAQRIR
jgi:glutamate-1-semialdehyde 2,1-aminomutase